MRKKSWELLILIVVINFIVIIFMGVTVIDNRKTIITNNSTEKDRLEMIKDKGVFTIVAPPSDIPFFYKNPETNKISGIDAEISTEIAKRLGVNKVEIKDAPFSDLLKKLNTDDSVDMAVGGLFIIPEAEDVAAFTKPLYKETETVIVPKYSTLNFMSDLKNARVGVEKGSIIFENLAQRWKNDNLIKDVVIYDTISDLLAAISSQKIDAGVADSIIVNSILSKENKFILRTLKNYTPELNTNIGMAVRKNNASLLKELNKILDEMRADRTLYGILAHNGLDKSNLSAS